jgi:hypothetical protein
VSAAPLEIPQRPEDLSAGWLTRVLRHGGVLDRARVAEVRAESCGDGQGLASRVLRLHVRYEPTEPGVPCSLIAKLPSDVATNRATAEMVGAYEREIHFYRELAPEVEVGTPRHYYSSMDPNPREQSADRIERLLERTPTALLAFLPGAFRWVARRSKRRYLLLLEDLAPARAGDQVAGCTTDEAARALRALAATHARFWDSPRLEDLPWLATSSVAPRFRQAVFRRKRRQFGALCAEFEAEYGALPESMLAAADWLGDHGIAVHERLATPPLTLLHGDYRLDNLFFAPPGDGPCSIEGEAARQSERELLEDYHAALVAGGVKGYDLEECRRDCELSKLVLLQSIVLSAGALEVDDEQASALARSFIPRLAALLPEGNLDRLLA